MTMLSVSYGKQVSELSCILEDYGTSVLDRVNTESLVRYRQTVNTIAYQFRVAERELCTVEHDRRRMDVERHGYERTLVMVSRSNPTDEGLILRLMERISDRREQIIELTADAAFLQERMKTLSADLRGAHSAEIEALEVCIERAAATKRREGERQRRREVQRSAADVSSFSDPLWSPVALIGYRAWDIRLDGMYGAWKRWTTPQLRATCKKGDGVPHTNGQCGSVAFGCGIYAAKDAMQLMESYRLKPSASVAIGRVALEGRVVEHDNGYRAEHARVAVLITAAADNIRIINRFDELEQIFEDPRRRTRLGTKIKIPRDSGNQFRSAVSDHLTDRESGGTLWT